MGETSRTELWSLYDQVEEHQVDGLKFAEVGIILKSVPIRNRHHWLAWKTGEKSWKPLSGFPELKTALKSVFDKGSGLGPDDEVTKTATYIRSIGLPLAESESTIQASEVLNFSSLIAKKFEIEIEGKNERFLTFTRAISLGELHLVDSLPDWVDSTFQLWLRNGNEKVTLSCEQKTEENPENIVYIRENRKVELLKTWIFG